MADHQFTVKPQPTIKGYNAWVFGKLMEAKGVSQAEIASWIIDRWIDDNPELLGENFGITREEFLRSQHVQVVPHPSSHRRGGE